MTPIYVLDASVALCWVLPDEFNADALKLRGDAMDQPEPHLIVPPIFWSEIANVLAVAVQRARIDSSLAEAALNALRAFGVEEYAVDPLASLATAISDHLGAYDAQYLVLAQEMQASLWTLDARLAQATRQHGITVDP